MEITLKLFATLRKHIKESEGGVCTLQLPENTSVNTVVEQLTIPQDIPKIILINGHQKKPEDILVDGDTLSIFPPIAGG